MPLLLLVGSVPFGAVGSNGTVEFVTEVTTEVIRVPFTPGSESTFVVGVRQAIFMPSTILPGIERGGTKRPWMFM